MGKDANSVSKKRKSNLEVDDIDIYKKVVDFEEKEALQRSSKTDTELYLETCGGIRQLLGDIYKLKNENANENKPVIVQKKTDACLLTVLLKKLNRLDKVRMLNSREKLNQEKQKLDSINLQFQNLLYEHAHLMSEFKKCKQYKSKDEDIELVSVDEFLRDAEPAVTDKFKDKSFDNTLAHEMHLAMLEHELEQRIRLSKLCDQFEQEKKQLAADIISRKKILDGLGPRLSAVIEATKPLQEYLGLPIDKIRAEHKLACLLPDQLYLLYCNGDAYKQVSGNDIGMSIVILGDQEEAIQYNEAEKVKEPDSEAETEAKEELTETKKRRHRKASQIDKNEEKKKKILEGHPLSVEISIAIKDGPVLKIKFVYRSHLKIVTVTSEIDMQSSNQGNISREVLSGDSVLNELFENDFGKESPNASNFFQLKKVGLGTYESLVHKLGYSYTWAQKICGLDFLDSQNLEERANKISQTNIEAVLTSIHKRLKTRFMLSEHLQQLEQNCIPALPENVEYPKSAASTLTNFESMTFQTFCQATPNAFNLIDSDVVDRNDMFYTVTIARPKALLHASVVIKNDYPMRTPLFILSLKYNGEHNATNSDDIRDMERAVNMGWENNITSGWLISAQIRFLCSYLDVFLETSEGSGFNQTTVFFRSFRARNRRKPFKFMKVGNGIYIQY